jgi:DNA-binding transcriptional ArsR family regulator
MITTEKKIFYDTGIPSSAKMLYAYIAEKRKIEETNEQLAVRFNVTSVSISNWLSKLEEADYVKLSYSKRKRVVELID